MSFLLIALLGTAPGMAFLSAGRPPLKAAPAPGVARVEVSDVEVESAQPPTATDTDMEEDCGGD